MTVTEMFQGLLNNIKVDNAAQITQRYEEITRSLNNQFRDTESKTANSLQVGSYGRWTAIKGVSDLDMLYIMPKGKWDDYKNDHSKLLTDTKDAIKARYPTTNVRVDRLVVTATYTNFHIEIQPVFEQEDGSFKYPDTYNGGSWKITKPREEISAIKEFDADKNKNLRRLCKMARAWKNKHGVGMGGLLIDTLAYNFLQSTTAYDDKSFLYYDWMSRDFFKFLMEQPNQDHYKALGSGQNVKVKKRFQKKAKKAYELSLKAIEAGDTDSAHNKWKKVYGRPFPAKAKQVTEDTITKAAMTWDDTEQFIEDLYPIDIRYNINIDCEVSQKGFREHFLTQMLAKRIPLLANKNLLFSISSIGVPQPYDIKWKVLNRGFEAQNKNCVRGQIDPDNGYKNRKESTNFIGEHVVECYAIKNGVVVAKDRIDVPIAA
ncbi:MAG: nucleotide-binding domain-containing protein [Pontibacterium sp.]